MKRNKLIIFFLAIMTVFILSACGDGTGGGGNRSGNGNDDEEIVDDNGNGYANYNDNGYDDEDYMRFSEGTVVAILEDEILFVTQLDLSDELLARTDDEWFESDEMSDIYRLTGIESDLDVGTELRISYAITTMSIPPLIPVVDYEIIEN